MNDYLKAFWNVTQSSEQLLTDEYKSIEIKQSAGQLKESIQPCVQELKQSGARLNSLVQACFNELERAEDVWNSKPRIAEAAKDEIWEQLGELSGRHIRIVNLGLQCKKEAVEKAQTSWEKIIELLKKRWFIDAKQQLKKGIGWGEKDEFINALNFQIRFYLKDMDEIVKNYLKNIFIREIESFNLQSKICQNFFEMASNWESQAKKQFERTISIKSKNVTQNFCNDSSIKSLGIGMKHGRGDLEWKAVVQFKDKVNAEVEAIIISTIYERIKMATEFLEYAISFYNNFLETQERFQQETLAQRYAEKSWIDQQRQQLEQVQKGIDAILNQAAG